MSEIDALTRTAGEACRHCGERLGNFGFCLSCGVSVDSDELGPVAGEPVRRSRTRRVLRRIVRWRTPLVVVPLLAGLAIVGGMGAQLLMAKIPPAEVVPRVDCWDGHSAASAADCDRPSGVDGLRWVFPTFHPKRDDCVDVLIAHPEYPRPAMYECDFKVLKHWVKVTYMELADVDAGRRYFEKYFAGSERERLRTAEGAASRYVWRERIGGRYQLAAMYIDFPFAVSIDAPAAIYRDRALRDLAFRHPDKLRAALAG